MINDFVWPSDRARAENVELNRVCEYLEEVLDSAKGAEPVANWWKPEQCPITNLPFFMWIEHPEKGWTPTYGGPLDSYTIPEFDGDIYTRERFDHDEGAWILDEVEDVGVQIVDDQLFVTEKDPNTQPAQQGGVPEFRFDEWWDQKARYIDHRSTKALARAAYKAGFGETYSGTTPQPQSAEVPEWAEELKKLAETATPGPWHGGHGACLDAVAVDYRDEIGNTAPESFTKIGGHAKMICKASPTGWRDISQVVRDMEYIAAANPEAVLALINLLTTTPQPQSAEVPDSWRECLAEMVRAMHDYEMDVDEDAPYKHRSMMDRAHALLSTNTTPQPADGGCLCQGCGNRYQFDVIVDDETWERIKPPKKAAGGGLLCPNCIANRVHQVGTGLWSAGYLSPIEQISPQPPREQEGE